MKRRLLVLCLVFGFCLAAVLPAAAASKKEVLQELKDTFVGKYIEIDPENETAEAVFIIYMAENAIRNLEFTEAQGDLFIQLIRECAAFVSDKGPSISSYTAAERAFVLERVQRVADELGLRLTINGKMILIYDANGMLIFHYDSNFVKKTGA